MAETYHDEDVTRHSEHEATMWRLVERREGGKRKKREGGCAETVLERTSRSEVEGFAGRTQDRDWARAAFSPSFLCYLKSLSLLASAVIDLTWGAGVAVGLVRGTATPGRRCADWAGQFQIDPAEGVVVLGKSAVFSDSHPLCPPASPPWANSNTVNRPEQGQENHALGIPRTVRCPAPLCRCAACPPTGPGSQRQSRADPHRARLRLARPRNGRPSAQRPAPPLRHSRHRPIALHLCRSRPIHREHRITSSISPYYHVFIH